MFTFLIICLTAQLRSQGLRTCNIKEQLV